MITLDLPILKDIETPALILWRPSLERNIAAMTAIAAAGNFSLRPHAKTHKSAAIAHLQVRAGAVGICCATVAEIEALADARLSGLVLTAPVADRNKAARLANVVRKTEVAVVVDHADYVDLLASHVGRADHPLQVLIDVDVGHGRTGVCEPSASVALARQIQASSHLRFCGLQGFGGHIQHVVEFDGRRSAAKRAAAQLYAHMAALREVGLPTEIVTGGGTGTSMIDGDGPYTELQVGSYVFMDADYGRLVDASGRPLPFGPSLFVLATVISTNRNCEIVVDAGVKALAFNGPAPCLFMGVPVGSVYRFAGDEHGIVTIPRGCARPSLGDRILIQVTHCDPTVNLYGHYNVLDERGCLERWPILGRH